MSNNTFDWRAFFGVARRPGLTGKASFDASVEDLRAAGVPAEVFRAYGHCTGKDKKMPVVTGTYDAPAESCLGELFKAYNGPVPGVAVDTAGEEHVVLSSVFSYGGDEELTSHRVLSVRASALTDAQREQLGL